MSLIVIKSGILTSVQDLGRSGFRKFGINSNGAMDRRAVRLINVLLGNNENEAVLEMYFPASKFKFQEDAVIAIGGADFGAMIDKKMIENWRPFFIEKGQTLSFESRKSGNIAYLSVKGGFEIEDWLNSKSTNLSAKIGGFTGRSLSEGDELSFKSKVETASSNFDYFLSHNLFPERDNSPIIRIIAGAEFDYLTGLSEEILLKKEFTISSNSSRMGFRLTGEPLYLLDQIELVSSAVSFGTIQLLPDGQMIILMADHQTTGGYPLLAHVISADLPLLAQLGANAGIRFKLISTKEAENLILEFERDLNLLKIGCSANNKRSL